MEAITFGGREAEDPLCLSIAEVEADLSDGGSHSLLLPRIEVGSFFHSFGRFT